MVFVLGGGLLPAVMPGRTAEPVRVQLKWRHQFQFAGYYAAQAKGFYDEAGLDVTILEGGPEHPPLEAVLNGAARFGVTDSDVVQARMKGAPVVACAVVFQHTPYVLLSRRDRNIRTPADLIGKSVMLSDDQGAAQLRGMLQREGIDPARVKMENHSWRLADLAEGRVDVLSAYATVEPLWLRARGVETSQLRSVDYGVDFYGDTLFTNETELVHHPARVAAFTRASMKGWEYAMAHPGEIADVILALPGVKERGITRELLLQEAHEMEAFVLPGLVEIGHINPDRWEQIARAFADMGLAPKQYSLAGFIFDPTLPPDRRFINWLIGFGLGLLLLALLAFAWSVQLRRTVRERTRELQVQSDERKRLLEAEQAARGEAEHARQKVDQILASVTDAFITLDRHWCYVYVNDRAAQLFNRRREDLVGKPVWNEFPGEEGQPFHLACERAMLQRVAVQFQYYHAARDAWFESRIYPSSDGISLVLQDITEHKRADEALRESDERFRQITENIREVFWLSDPAKSQMLYISPAYDAIWGRAHQELYTSPLAWVEAIHPDDRARVRAATVTRQVAGTYDEEFRIVRPDGSVRWVRDRAFPVRNGAGEIYRIAGVSEDITDWKRTEEELQCREREQRELAGQLAAEKARLVTAQAVAKVGSWETDLATGAVVWSGETHRIFETPPDFQPTHPRFIELVHPDDRGAVNEAFVDSLASRTPCAIEHRLVTPAGRIKIVEERWQVYFDAEGKPIRALGTCQDITGRKGIEEELRRSEASLANAQRIARIGNWDLDILTGKLTWSDQIHEIFGITKTRFGANLEALMARVHPQDRERVGEAQHNALAGKARLDIEHRIVLPDGTVKIVHELGDLTRDAEGRPVRLVGTVQDITARRQAELVSNRLAAIIESSDDAIIGTDFNGIITDWNGGAAKIYGYAADEMVGGTIGRLIPAGREQEEPVFLERVRGGGSVQHFETTRLAKDGRLIDVSVAVSPIKDITGAVCGISMVARDITARKLHEREIVRLSRLYAALSQINQAIVWTRHRDELFTQICRVLVESGGFSTAWIGWLDGDTKQVVPVAQWGDQTGYLEQLKIYADDRPAGQGPVGTAIREGRNYICNDFHRDPRMVLWRESAAAAGFCAAAAFPIWQNGAACGAMTVYSAEIGVFRDKESALLEEAAGNVSFGLDNLVREQARQQAEVELRAADQQLHSLVARLHTIREEEAKRIARELHDDLGQQLTALNMEIDALETGLSRAGADREAHLVRMRANVEHTIEVVQKISGELRLGQLDILGLPAAIEWHLAEFSRRSGLASSITRLDDQMRLDDAQATGIFRILQEALTNIARHAGATHVEVSLQAGPDRLTLRVADNGRGITAAERADRKAIGLLGMRERAQLLGGDVTISGTAGSGTTVLATIPLRRSTGASA